MKELRFDADGGVWRVAFAFNPKRRGVLLAAGDKSGGSEKRFYRSLLEAADARFDAHLARLKKEHQKSKTLTEKMAGLSGRRRKKSKRAPRNSWQKKCRSRRYDGRTA